MKTEETKCANPKLAPFRKNANSHRASSPDSPGNWLRFAKLRKPKIPRRALCGLSAKCPPKLAPFRTPQARFSSAISALNLARNWLRFVISTHHPRTAW
jgi:hypothetical protein